MSGSLAMLPRPTRPHHLFTTGVESSQQTTTAEQASYRKNRSGQWAKARMMGRGKQKGHDEVRRVEHTGASGGKIVAIQEHPHIYLEKCQNLYLQYRPKVLIYLLENDFTNHCVFFGISFILRSPRLTPSPSRLSGLLFTPSHPFPVIPFSRCSPTYPSAVSSLTVPFFPFSLSHNGIFFDCQTMGFPFGSLPVLRIIRRWLAHCSCVRRGAKCLASIRRKSISSMSR